MLPSLSALLADSDDEDNGGKSSGGGDALAMIEKLKLHLDVQGEQLAEELNGAEVTFISVLQSTVS